MNLKLISLLAITIALVGAKSSHHHHGHDEETRHEGSEGHHEMTPCQQAVSSSSPLLGAFRPQCDDEGNFLPLQCDGSTGHCWCVDSLGKIVDGTLTPPAQARPLCEFREAQISSIALASAETASDAQLPSQELQNIEDEDAQQEDTAELDKPLTACQKERQEARDYNQALRQIHHNSEHSSRIHVPKCTKSGEYRAKQCEGRKKKRVCWCVDDDGHEIANTRFGRKDPSVNCKAARHPEEPVIDSEPGIDDESTSIVEEVVPEKPTQENSEVEAPAKANLVESSGGKNSSYWLGVQACVLAAAVVAFVSFKSRRFFTNTSQDTEVVV